MRNKLINLSFIIFITLVSLNNVTSWGDRTFNNSLTNETLIFTGNQTITRYLTIPSNVAFLTQGYLNLTGYLTGGGVNNWSDNFTNNASSGFSGGMRFYLISGNRTLKNVTVDSKATFTNISLRLTSNGSNLATGIRNGTNVPIVYNLTNGTTYWLVSSSDGNHQYNGEGSPSFPKTSPDLIWDRGLNPTTGTEDTSNEGYDILKITTEKIYPSGLDIGDIAISISDLSANGTTSSTIRTSNLASTITRLLNSTYLVGSNYIIPFEFQSGISGSLSYSDMSFSNEGFIENSQNYSTTVYETQSQVISLNISYDSSDYTTVSGILNYEGNAYSSTQTGTGDEKVFTASVSDVPLITNSTNMNKSFYWTVSMTNSSGTFNYTTSTINQSVNPIYLISCNATYNVPVINFTAKDEVNFTELNASVEAFFQFWMGSGAIKKNYSFSDTTQTDSRFDFCAFPNIFSGSTVLKTDMDMAYTKTGYLDRSYFLRNASLINTTSSINLPLLSSTLGTKFTFTVKQGGQRLQDATVTISKLQVSNGTYQAIGIRQTDENGNFVEYLEIDKSYSFSFTRNSQSFGTLFRSATCTALPCEMELVLEDTIGSSFSGYYNEFAQNIAYNLSFNPTNKMVTLVYNDLTGLAQYVRLEVLNLRTNETSLLICNSTLYSTAGTMTCNCSNYSGDFRANAYISRSPELFISYIDFFVSTVTSVLRSNGLIVALLMIILVVCAFWADVSLGLISLPIVMIVLKITEFMPLSWATIGGFGLLCLYLASYVNR